MVKKFSLVSAVATMLTGSALLVAQEQQTETPPPAQPNQQQKAGQQDAERSDAEREREEQQRQERERQQRQREEQQRRQSEQRRQQDEQRDAAPQERQDRQTDQARDRAPQDRRGPELDRPGSDRPGSDRQQPGQRQFDQGRQQFDGSREARGQFDRGQRGQAQGQRQFDSRGQFEGRAQFERGQQGQRQGIGLNVESTEQGQLTVQSIEQGSPAARIGLREGDRIVSVNGRTFESADQLNRFLIESRTQRVPIVIDRDGQRETVFWMAEQRFTPTPDPRFAQDQFGPRGFAQGQMQGQQGMRAALGVHLDPHAPVAVVSRVAPGSPAEQAGIQQGDQIVALNGQDIRHYSEFVNQAAQLPLEQPATLEIVSRGEQQPQPVQVVPEPWHVVYRDSGTSQQFGQQPFGQQQFGQPMWGQPQYGQQYGWSQQQFGAVPQYGAQPQFGGQMGFEQRGQYEMRQQPMGQPYGVARPPLGQGMQSGGTQQEIDELHREVDSLREQVQQLRQQVQSHHGGAQGRPGLEGARPEPPRPPQQPRNVPQEDREI